MIATVTVPCDNCGESVAVEVTAAHIRRGLLVADEWEAEGPCACTDFACPRIGVFGTVPFFYPDIINDLLNNLPNRVEIYRALRTEADDDAADARYRASIGD